MNTLITTSRLLITILTGLTASVIQSNAGEQTHTGDEALRPLFDQAVIVDGENYLSLRSNILARGTAVVPFLQEQIVPAAFHSP
jgi:hypothetical protein